MLFEIVVVAAAASVVELVAALVLAAPGKRFRHLKELSISSFALALRFDANYELHLSKLGRGGGAC